MTNVLVVGSGGREHALAWKLDQSSRVDTVYVAPGNGGTKNCVSIPADDISSLADFASDNKCFTVVGPEAPLSAGIFDLFESRGIRLFGPGREAARLESSKAWAKSFMIRHNIRTAAYGVFGDMRNALEYVEAAEYDVVVKADGLAAGKGVTVCNDKDSAYAAIRDIMQNNRFGDAGRQVVIEENLAGVEASYIAICDGTVSVPMATSRDHKRALNGDLGPNTGGMGAYSPTQVIDDDMACKIQSDIIQKTVSGMKDEGAPFSGFLYAGIMISHGEPYVLEYNVRMGDPECQPIVMRMDFDLFQYMDAAVSGNLSDMSTPRWNPGHAACVVLASRGYPGKYRTGQTIRLPPVPSHTRVFHAGTRRTGGDLQSSGGRVLGVTSLGSSLEDALSRAYNTANMVSWDDKYCRTDIGRSGI